MKGFAVMFIVVFAFILFMGAFIDTMKVERQQSFGKAYGSCKYDLETRIWKPSMFTADHEADDAKRTDIVFLCLASKGYDRAESVKYLHGYHLVAM